MLLKRLKLLRITMATLVTFGLLTFLGRAILEVSRGNGARIYANAYGMQIHWVTVLTFAASLSAAFLVGLALRWWQTRDDRTLDRLQRARRDESSERR